MLPPASGIELGHAGIRLSEASAADACRQHLYAEDVFFSSPHLIFRVCLPGYQDLIYFGHNFEVAQTSKHDLT